MVYQNPGAALNPTIRVGDQVAEVYTLAGTDETLARERAEGMLAKVQIADPQRHAALRASARVACSSAS